MVENHEFSKEFKDCIEMMETLSTCPILAEKLIRKAVYKDFKLLLQIYCEEIIH